MATIRLHDFGGDTPTSECESCGVFFDLSWHRNAVYDKPEYCPFCGEEIEETIEPTEDTPCSDV